MTVTGLQSEISIRLLKTFLQCSVNQWLLLIHACAPTKTVSKVTRDE